MERLDAVCFINLDLNLDLHLPGNRLETDQNENYLEHDYSSCSDCGPLGSGTLSSSAARASSDDGIATA